MKKRFTTLVLILLIAALILVGCGNKSAIVGKWQGTLNTLTFQSDGTVISSVLGFGTQGTYKFIDKDTVSIIFQGISTDYTVKISDNSLYLDNNGMTLTYDKMKN